MATPSKGYNFNLRLQKSCEFLESIFLKLDLTFNYEHFFKTWSYLQLQTSSVSNVSNTETAILPFTVKLWDERLSICPFGIHELWHNAPSAIQTFSHFRDTKHQDVDVPLDCTIGGARNGWDGHRKTRRNKIAPECLTRGEDDYLLLVQRVKK